MKLNKTTVVLLAAGLLTTAVQADEKGRGSGKGRPEARGKGGERPDRGAAMAKALGLNEKQALQMKKLQEDQRAAFGKLMAEARESENREGFRERFGALREEYQKKVRAILTEEQAKKLEEMRRSPQGRLGQRPGGEGKGRPGQRPGGEGKGKGRPGKKGSEASFEGVQYVLNDDRHRDDHRRGKSSHGRPDAKGPQARGPQRGGPQPPHGRSQGPRPGFSQGHGPKGPQARGPQRGGPRHDFGKPGPGPKGPQIRGKQSHGKPSGCSSCKGNKPGHGPKGPQARGPRPSHGSPKGRPEPHRGHRGPRR